jgi:hypothetical protein
MSTQEKTTIPDSLPEEGGAGWDPHSRLLRRARSEVRSTT